MRRLRKFSSWIAPCLLLGFGAAHAHAQDYPAREIHAICPFGPGTGADILVRYFSAKLSELAGKPVVVDNRPGAQGNIATETVARAKPDGYTIAITPASSTLAAAAHLFKKLPFDPIKDFAPVGTISTLSFVAIVDAKKPIHSVAELTQYLKDKKQGAFFGGSANTGIVSAELYLQAIGLRATRVSYRQVTDTLADMLNGNIDFTFTDASWVVEQAKAGRVRPLAVTGPKRTAALPDVPTLREAGVPVELTAWWGVLVPAGTPQGSIDKLASWFERILAAPETTDFLLRFGNDPLPGNADLLRQMLARDLERWGEYVRLAKIEPQ